MVLCYRSSRSNYNVFRHFEINDFEVLPTVCFKLHTWIWNWILCQLYTFKNRVCSTNGKSVKRQFHPYEILKITKTRLTGFSKFGGELNMYSLCLQPIYTCNTVSRLLTTIVGALLMLTLTHWSFDSQVLSFHVIYQILLPVNNS